MYIKNFNDFYIQKIQTLSGIIQLFNCFNAKNANLKKAIKDINKYDKTLAFSENIEKYFYDKPVYFGFSKVVINNKKLGNIAKNIFENTPANLKKIYEKDFSQNRFYHPMYINRAYKNPNIQSFLFEFMKFFRNSL